MATDTATKTKAKANMFDEDITSIHDLELPAAQPSAYRFEVYDVINDEERYMVDAFHQQYIAVEGRTAVAKLIDTRSAELGTHSVLVMGQTMENVERIEAASQVGRLTKRQHDFDNRVTDQVGRHLLETNAIAVRTMHEDMRRSPYRPPAPPSPVPPQRKKWKGIFPAIGEFLFGEA
jgi:hypothetical protein